MPRTLNQDEIRRACKMFAAGLGRKQISDAMAIAPGDLIQPLTQEFGVHALARRDLETGRTAHEVARRLNLDAECVRMLQDQAQNPARVRLSSKARTVIRCPDTGQARRIARVTISCPDTADALARARRQMSARLSDIGGGWTEMQISPPPAIGLHTQKQPITVDGVRYPSRRDAAQALGISPDTLRDRLRRQALVAAEAAA